MTIGTLIKEYRMEHSLSQRRFALNCNLSNGYISMLENGANPKTGQPVTPTLPALQRLAIGMGMSLTELLSRIDDVPVDLKSTPDGCDKATSIQSLNPVDSEILSLISALSSEQKKEAITFLRFLSQRDESNQ